MFTSHDLAAVIVAGARRETSRSWRTGADVQDEEPFMNQFRKAANERYGLNLKDYMEFHAWSIKEHAKFMDLAWDYLGIIGERGDGPAFIPGTRMDEEQPYFPKAKIK